MTRNELIAWLFDKGYREIDKDILAKKENERFALRYDGARFQKYSPVNGWRTLFFQKYEGLSISPEGKLSGLNVMISNGAR